MPRLFLSWTPKSELKEHSERLNGKVFKLEEELERSKEQVVTLTRRLEKSRGQSAKLVEQLKESVNSNADEKAEDNEMRDAELGELRKVTRAVCCVQRI